MDFEQSCTSRLPWIWVVETLAHSDQVDISLLLDLLDKTPEISDDVGRNAREVVSLKILERFFIEGSLANPVSSASYEKIKLDLSDSCEDVLQRILAEKYQPTSPLGLKLADLKMEKWDLQPYIQYKRSSLPIYTLKQLKDAILTGKNSFLASLREQSGLSVGNQHEHGARMGGGKCNGTTPRLERSNTGENVGGTSCENQIVANNGSAKKHKHDVCSEQIVGDKFISSDVDTQLAEAVAACMENNGERCNLGSMNHVGDMGVNGPSDDDNDEGRCSLGEMAHVEVMSQCGSSADHKGTSMEGAGGHDEVLPHEEQSPPCDTDMPNGKFDEEHMQDNDVNLDKVEQNVPTEVPNVSEAEGFNMPSDGDGCLDDKASIDTKKRNFLSSQCTYSQESLATTNWTQLNVCMKCSKGGDLLVCSSDSCPIVTHVRCLGSDPTYDSNGKFYCPFCAYSQAILKYMEIKKKASLARKNLATFICVGAHQESKEQSHLSGRIKQNGLQREEVEHEITGPSELRFGDNLPSRGNATGSTNGTAHDLDKDKQEGERTIKVSHSRRIHEKQQADEMGIHKPREENTSTLVLKRRDMNKNHTCIRSKKGSRSPPETESSHERRLSSNSESVDWHETSDEEYRCESSGASKYHTRVRKRKLQHSYPAIPQFLRRKQLPWTIAEENALLDGIRLLSNPGDKVMPWTKILEFGADVFDKTRSTVDLKDKWRNLRKTGSKI